MDDAFKDGRGSHGWSLGDFHYHKKPNEKGRQLSKPSLFIRSAAEIELPREIRSYLSRRSSHVSDWVLIVGNRAHYNLRTSDRLQLFEKTRKGWVPLKELNGIRSGQEVLAFQRRPTVRSSKYLGDARRDLPGQLAYDAMVQQVFFHRDLKAYLNGHGYPSREQILQRLNRPSLEQMSRTLDNVERVETAKHWICLNLHDADGQPAAGYPYRLRDSGGAERRGELDNQGEAREVNLTDGPVEVIFGEAIDLSSVASQRQAIKQGLDTVLKAERAEADAIEAEFQQKSLFGKLGALEEARATGAREAVWGLMTGFKELSDLATQHVNHAISAAWESWRYSEEGEYTEQFVQHFVDAEFKELADVLGFDPRSLTREQWADTLALANFIWHDGETRELLIKFAQDYINAQHFLETTEAVSGFATEFAFELLVSILTLGAGATVAVAAKARHMNKLKGLASQLRQLAQSLKRQAGRKEGEGRTGHWHYQTIDKPEGHGIEKVLIESDTASHQQADRVTMRVDDNAQYNINPQYLRLVTDHPNAHSLTRHGGNVTNDQLMRRALTGVAPDGHVKMVKGKTVLPPMSSAFHSDELLISADQIIRNNGALKAVISRNPGKSIITVKPADVGDLGVNLGRGFEKIGGNKLEAELQGPPRLVDNLRSVQATYEFNRVKKVWETITIFPSR